MSVSSVSVYVVPGLAKAGAVQVNCNNAVVSVSGATVTHKSTTCNFQDAKIECTTTLSVNASGSISSISYNLQCDNNTVLTINFTCSGLTVSSGDTITIKAVESYST